MNKTCRYYISKYKRNEVLEKLLIILKRTKSKTMVDDVRKDINALRSNYGRELKKIEQSRRFSAGANTVYTRRVRPLNIFVF